MTKFIAVVSGKGGAGKTTVAINLAMTLTGFKREIVLMDANLINPHIGLHLGAPILPVHLNDVLEKKKSIKDAIYAHPTGLKIVPLDIARDQIDKVSIEDFRRVFDGMKGLCEAVIIDGSMGTGEHISSIVSLVDAVIVVTTPELPDCMDALKTIRLIKRRGGTLLGVVVNKMIDDEFGLPMENIRSLIAEPIIGVIPHDHYVRHSIKLQQPVTHSYPDSPASQGFKVLASKLIGEQYIHSIEKKDKGERIYSTVLRKLGLR